MRRLNVYLMLLALLGAGSVSVAEAQEPRPAPRAGEARGARPPLPLTPARGWLGLMFDEARAPAAGVVVREVHPGSPAALAGMQAGDVVVQLNGRAATGEGFRELRLQPGDTVRVRVRRERVRDRELALVAAGRPAPERIEVLRRGSRPGPVVVIDGDTVRIPTERMIARADTVMGRMRMLLRDSLPVHLREFERRIPEIWIQTERDTVQGQRPARGEVFDFALGGRAIAGAEFAELNPALAEYFRGAGEGLLVLRVAPGTPAGRAGLQEGDVVVRAGGEPVRTIPELRRAIRRAEQRDVQLDLVRQGAPREVRLRWER